MEKSMTTGLSKERAHTKIFLDHYYPAEDHEVIAKQGTYADYLVVMTTMPSTWHDKMVNYIHTYLNSKGLPQPFILTETL